MRRFHRLVEPAPQVHPCVRALWEKMHEQQLGMQDLGERSGVNWNTIKDWFYGRTVPNINNLEACLNVVGSTLVVRGIVHD